jgi:tRNA nucleotidyltransferase/poly(A) polymerase
MRSLDAAPFDLTLRMALLLHDVAKPLTRTRDRFGYHFFHHDRIGAEMARSILKRLRYPRPFMNEVSLLVERHLFEVAPLLSSDAALRRFLRRVGEGEAERLIELRKADVRGMGPGRTPSADLRRLLSRIRLERKRRPALEIKDLTIGGEEILKWLQIAPGPPVGRILRRLLEKVLENPALNQRERLKQMVLRDLRDNALH